MFSVAILLRHRIVLLSNLFGKSDHGQKKIWLDWGKCDLCCNRSLPATLLVLLRNDSLIYFMVFSVACFRHLGMAV